MRNYLFMVNFISLISEELSISDIDLSIEDVPLNIFLLGDIVLSPCFIESEYDDYLVVSELNEELNGELRFIPKENINYIGVVYKFLNLAADEEINDNMFS